MAYGLDEHAHNWFIVSFLEIGTAKTVPCYDHTLVSGCQLLGVHAGPYFACLHQAAERELVLLIIQCFGTTENLVQAVHTDASRMSIQAQHLEVCCVAIYEAFL